VPRLVGDEQHPEDVRRHQDEHEHRDDVDKHVLVIPPNADPDAGRSAGVAGTLR
jgi:hypothetical protein